jgi:hypothetical protein
MGDSNGDGDGDGVDGDGFRGNSPSRQGVGTETFVPQNWSSMAAALRNFLWTETGLFRVFASEGFYRWKGDVRGWPGGPHHTLARPEGGAHYQVVWLPPGPPPSLLWTPSRVGKNRNFRLRFVQFREYFLCNFSETQKQQKTGTDTVASY